MALVAFPLLFLLLVFSYLSSRSNPIESDNILPQHHRSSSIYSIIFQNEIKSSWEILHENYLLWLSLYSFAYLVFYLPPCKSLFFSFKFNPNFPPISLIQIEFLRSFRGILICSCLEISINYLISQGYYQWNFPGIFEISQPLDQLSPWLLILAGVFLYLWGDFHFYWTHRLLHQPYLYKTVHKYHHESYNPDPFSGLSMHWLESFIYFSSAFILGLSGCPLFLVRIMFKSLIIFPLEGHNGYGLWSIESSNNHYIHHSKFNWNYGSSPLWDHLMKTNYPFPINSSPSSSSSSPSSSSSSSSTSLETKNQSRLLSVDDKKRYEESLQQAYEVGCEIHEEYCQPSQAIPTSAGISPSPSSTTRKTKKEKMK